MILDPETFTDIVVAVQQVKEHSLEVAKKTAHISKHITDGDAVPMEDWDTLIESMSQVQVTTSRLECLLNAAYNASKEESDGTAGA